MKSDEIKQVMIDDTGRLRIYPTNEKFSMIWRTATEVHWDNNESFLYSPKPREWSYLDWFKDIISIIQSEANCQLTLTVNTLWFNIPNELKQAIEDWVLAQ